MSKNNSKKNSTWAINFGDESDTYASPPGYINFNAESSRIQAKKRSEGSSQEILALKQKKAWELAKSPFGGIFSTLLFSWLMGSGVNIVTFMFIFFYTLYSPISQILNVNNAFQRFKDPSFSVFPQMLLYILLSAVPLAIGLNKCYNMGLLPTEADSAFNLPVKQFVEFSSGSFFN